MDKLFYITGGTLPQDASSYVTRRADTELLEGLRRGEFCYVLNTRQMGKSSLMVRTANQLKAEGCRVAILDLTAVGKNLTVEQWYFGLLSRVVTQVRSNEDLIAFWKTNRELGPMQRFIEGLRRILLEEEEKKRRKEEEKTEEDALSTINYQLSTPAPLTPHTPHLTPAPLVLFVDEIDAVLSLPFSADEFFAGIRECYNRRAQEPVFARLTFCLLGVATPADLIRDVRTTPFNIGRRIELRDFTPTEAAPLASGLNHGEHGGGKGKKGKRGKETAFLLPPTYLPNAQRPTSNTQRLLKRVLYWTNGHPYMTQRLCREIAEQQAKGIVTTAEVDRLCERLFLSKAAQESDDNLAFVRNRLLKSEVDLPSLLDLYAQVWAGRRVRDDETNPLCGILRLSGAVAVKDGLLRVRCRIYDTVFDRNWIRAHMPDAELERQKRAYRLGLMRAAAGATFIVSLMAVLAAYAFSERNHAKQNEVTAEEATQRADSIARQKAALAGTLELAFKRAVTETKEARTQRENAEKQRLIAKHLKDIANHREQAAINARNEVEDQKSIVERQKGDVENERNLAQRQQKVAQDAERKEHNQRQIAGHARYVSDVQLTAQTLREGNTAKTLALLHTHIPKNGKNSDTVDQREFTWRFQWGLLHSAAKTFVDPGSAPESGVFTPEGKLLTINRQQVLTCRNLQTPQIEQTRQLAAVRSLLAPDGQTLAFQDKTNRLFVEKGKSENGAYLDVGNVPIRAWAFAPNSRWLLTIGTDGIATVWDMHTWTRVSQTSGLQKLPFHGNPVLLPDGKTFALAGAMEHTQVTLYDAHSANVANGDLHSFPMVGVTVTAIACSPDGALLAVGDYSGWVKIWNLKTHEQLRVIKTSARAITTALAFAPDSNTLAIAKSDHQIHLYSLSEEKERQPLAGHEDGINFVCWSRDGRLLASGSEDATARIWNAVPAPASQELPFEHQTMLFRRTAALLPRGRFQTRLLYGTGSGIWNACVFPCGASILQPGRLARTDANWQ